MAKKQMSNGKLAGGALIGITLASAALLRMQTTMDADPKPSVQTANQAEKGNPTAEKLLRDARLDNLGSSTNISLSIRYCEIAADIYSSNGMPSKAQEVLHTLAANLSINEYYKEAADLNLKIGDIYAAEIQAAYAEKSIKGIGLYWDPASFPKGVESSRKGYAVLYGADDNRPNAVEYVPAEQTEFHIPDIRSGHTYHFTIKPYVMDTAYNLTFLTNAEITVNRQIPLTLFTVPDLSYPSPYADVIMQVHKNTAYELQGRAIRSDKEYSVLWKFNSGSNTWVEYTDNEVIEHPRYQLVEVPSGQPPLQVEK